MALTATYRPGHQHRGQERRRAVAERRHASALDHGVSTAYGTAIGASYVALAIIFLWIGALKLTDYEAIGVAGFIMNSPLLAWMHGAFGIQGASNALGAVEVSIGALLLARWYSPKLSAIGAAMSVVTYLITLSLMLSTPGVTVQEAGGFPMLSAAPGQFLAKDMVLLAVSVLLLGDSLTGARIMGRGMTRDK